MSSCDGVIRPDVGLASLCCYPGNCLGKEFWLAPVDVPVGCLDLPLNRVRRQAEEPGVEWIDISLTEKQHRAQILGALADELNGGTITGMSPLERDSVLYFTQQDISVVGRKKAL